MRIVGGAYKGRALTAPKGRDLRPTSDRVRESLFNILEHGVDGFDLDGVSAVDGFAGTGALGLEALSRGARKVAFLDNAAAALDAVKANIRALGIEGTAIALRLDATRPPPPPGILEAPCGLVLLDPPYQSGLAAPALSALAAKGWIADGAVCVVEVAAKEPFEPPTGFELFDERTYGAARLILLRYR